MKEIKIRKNALNDTFLKKYRKIVLAIKKQTAIIAICFLLLNWFYIEKISINERKTFSSS